MVIDTVAAMALAPCRHPPLPMPHVAVEIGGLEGPLHRHLLPLTLLSPFLPEFLDRGTTFFLPSFRVAAVAVELACVASGPPRTD